MKKLCSLIICVVLVISLAGCGSEKPEETKGNENDIAPEVTVTVPDGGDGYDAESRTEEITSQSSEITGGAPQGNGLYDGAYYANTNTKKFHRQSCGSAGRIKNDNLYITNSREELISSGYSPCKICEP